MNRRSLLKSITAGLVAVGLAQGAARPGWTEEAQAEIAVHTAPEHVTVGCQICEYARVLTGDANPDRIQKIHDLAHAEQISHHAAASLDSFFNGKM